MWKKDDKLNGSEMEELRIMIEGEEVNVMMVTVFVWEQPFI